MKQIVEAVNSRYPTLGTAFPCYRILMIISTNSAHSNAEKPSLEFRMNDWTSNRRCKWW